MNTLKKDKIKDIISRYLTLRDGIKEKNKLLGQIESVEKELINVSKNLNNQNSNNQNSNNQNLNNRNLNNRNLNNRNLNNRKKKSCILQ